METKPTDTKDIECAVRTILCHIGENPDREGLAGTPERIARMYQEIFRGYDPEQKPKITTFQNGSDGLVCGNVVIDTGNFHSMCEHHMLPFYGRYWFAYIPHPEGKVLGISKVGRVVDYCAARLQIQERLVNDIIDMIMTALGDDYPPLAIGLVMEGEHLCKSMRGVKKPGKMFASSFRGGERAIALKQDIMQIVNSERK